MYHFGLALLIIAIALIPILIMCLWFNRQLKKLKNRPSNNATITSTSYEGVAQPSDHWSESPEEYRKRVAKTRKQVRKRGVLGK